MLVATLASSARATTRLFSTAFATGELTTLTTTACTTLTTTARTTLTTTARTTLTTADRAHVACFAALGARGLFEGDALTLGEGLEAVTLDRGEVDKEVVTLGVGRETKTLGVVEERDYRFARLTGLGVTTVGACGKTTVFTRGASWSALTVTE
jgi:hypothetical protein